MWCCVRIVLAPIGFIDIELAQATKFVDDPFLDGELAIIIPGGCQAMNSPSTSAIPSKCVQ